MAFFMQDGYLRAHEYTVQFTCLKCPNGVSVLHEIFICSDVVSQVFLALVFLDRSVHRHVALVPTQLAGAAWWGEALPGEPHGSATLRNELLWGHLPSIHPPTLYGWGLHLYRPAPTCPGIRAVVDGSKSSMQDPRALHPPAHWLYVTASLTPVTFSASCHHLSSSSPTSLPSPMPEGTAEVSKLAQQKNFIHLSSLSLTLLCICAACV